MSTPGSLQFVFSAGIPDDDGDPLAGGLVYWYAAGTSTPLDTYNNVDLAVGHENANPVVLDASGRATIFLKPQGYKVVVRTSLGVLVFDEDNVEDLGQAFLASVGSAAGAKTQASGYQVVTGDIVVTAYSITTDPCVILLPVASTWTTELTIKNTGTKAVSVTPNGTDLLEGLNSVYTVPVSSGAVQPAITLKARSSSWYIVGSHKAP